VAKTPHNGTERTGTGAGLRGNDCACDTDREDDRGADLGDGDAPAPSRRVDQPRIERAVREILEAIGEDPNRDGLKETPQRVARAYAEMFAGLHEDPAVHLRKTFDERCNEIVLEKDVPFHSMCEHHLLPFQGIAHIAYLPGDRIVGISKLARVLEGLARRPQVQERLTNQLADLVYNELHARGVAVVLDATHSCMTIRGVKKPGSRVVTSALRGFFKSDPAARAEVMALIYHTMR
jgi:GTP cyclohydrolase I